MSDPRSAFRPSILANLRAATERPASGQTIRRIPLDQIEPDPDQPRRNPDDSELANLAASITAANGVLQPIGVRKRAGGYTIVFGERRWRAAAIAGLSDIPAFEVTEAQTNLTSQAIENQHRRKLSNTDLACAIKNLTAAGHKNAEIAAILNMPEQHLKHYRALLDLPVEIAPHADRASPRALYELARAWTKRDEAGRGEITAYLANGEEITLTAAFSFVGDDTHLPRSREPVLAVHHPSTDAPTNDDDVLAVQRDGPITNGSSSQHVRKTVVSSGVRRLNRPPYLPSDVREGLLEIARLVPEHIEVRAIIDRLIGGEGREQDAGKGRRVRGAGARP